MLIREADNMTPSPEESRGGGDAPTAERPQTFPAPGREASGPEGSLGAEASCETAAALTEARLREALSQFELLRAELQRERTRTEAELQVERRRAAAAEERVRQLEDSHQQVLDSLEEQRITSAELTTVLRAAEYRLAALEKTLETREAENLALRESQAGEAEHVRTLRAQIDTLVEAHREVCAERDRLKESLEALRAERVLTERELKSHKRRLLQRQEEIERLTRELSEARERAVLGPTAEIPLQSGAASAVNPAAALAAVQKREEALAAEMAQARMRIEELEDLLSREAAQRRTLEQTLAERQLELEEKTRACERLLHERSELQTAINALRHESEQVGRDLADARQLREHGGEQKSLMEARLAELERSLQASQEHEAILQATVAELQEVLQAEQAASSLLRTETQTREALRQALEHEVLEARARLSEMEARQQAMIQQHLLELAKINERARMLEAERDNLQEQLVSVAGVRDRLERECEQLRRRIEMEKQKGEMARLQAKLEEVELRHPEARVATLTVSSPPATSPLPSRPAGMAGRAPGALGVEPMAVPEDMPIVAIGASTGGPAVLSSLLPEFPADVTACFLIIQHMPPGYTAELASCLAQQSRIRVTEARHGDPLLPGTAYVAPGGHHMEVQDGRIRLTSSPPVNKHRPSVDVLFSSLVPLAKRVYAVLLSGMGNDGVAGMGRLHAAGAETIVQDEASSVVWGMPGAAAKAGCVKRQMNPSELAQFLLARTEARPSEEARAPEMPEAPVQVDGTAG